VVLVMVFVNYPRTEAIGGSGGGRLEILKTAIGQENLVPKTDKPPASLLRVQLLRVQLSTLCST